MAEEKEQEKKEPEKQEYPPITGSMSIELPPESFGPKSEGDK